MNKYEDMKDIIKFLDNNKNLVMKATYIGISDYIVKILIVAMAIKILFFMQEVIMGNSYRDKRNAKRKKNQRSKKQHRANVKKARKQKFKGETI